MDVDDDEYLNALITAANSFKNEPKVINEPKTPSKLIEDTQDKRLTKPKAKRAYSDEQKEKMVERLQQARLKSLETRQLKKGIKEAIKKETKEQEKEKLLEQGQKYGITKNSSGSPSAPQAPAIKPQPVAPVPQPSKVEVEVKQAPAAVSSGPKYFLPTRAFANKHAIKSLF